MKYFLLFLFLFLVGCVLGYFFEVLFRRFFSAHKWVNPGFMKGPWLPLYGFGLIIMFSLCLLFTNALPKSWYLYNPMDSYDLGYESGATAVDLIPIVSMGVGMTLLEFVAGLIFVKGFKVRLWDYTNMKGNILGIICPVFSVIWFAVSVLFYYAINPFVYSGAMVAYRYMFGDTSAGDVAHFGFIFFLGVCYGIMLIDFITSIGLFTRVSKLARDTGIVAKYEKLVDDMKKGTNEAKEKLMDSLPERLKETLEKPKDKTKAKEIVDSMKCAFLIDPNKEKKPSDNYDDKGRPVSFDEDDNQS